MGETGPRASVDALVDALTAGAEDEPETRVLDALVGRWRTTTAWEPVVGHGVRHAEGLTETRWIYGGRVLEARSHDADGLEVGTLLCAYDGLNGDYMAFAFNRLSTFFAVERGPFVAETRSLELDLLEPRRDGLPAVRVRRTVQLVGPDRYTHAISYPDVPVGTYGPMFITFDRID